MHHQGDSSVLQEPEQTAFAEDGVVRALSLASTLLNHPGGLTRDEIFEKVELYRGRYRAIDRLRGAEQQRARDALEKLFGHDKEHLRSCGIHLSEPTADEDYRYRVSRSQYGLPDLSLTPDEQMALYRAQLLFANNNIAGLQHALWAINPNHDGPSAPEAPQALQASIGSEAEISTLIDLARAGTGTPVTFSYTGYGRQSAEVRRVVPLGTGARAHWYLVGHDLDRGEQRLYRLDRVHGSVKQLPASRLSPDEREQLRQISEASSYRDLDISAVLDRTGRRPDARAVLEGALRAHQPPAPQNLPKLTTPPANLRKDDAATKTERVINMVALLLSRPEGVRPSQLLVKYSITPPQLLRDLLSIAQVNTDGFPETLEVQPYPEPNDEVFVSEYLAADEPIVLSTGAGSLHRPVSLTKPGALSLMIALKALIDVCPPGEEHIAAAAEQLQQKVIAIVPESIAQAAASMSLARTPADGRLLRTAQLAISAKHPVSLDYEDLSGRVSSDRIIDPVQILYDGPHTYLRAWCRQEAGERTFRLDRISELRPLPDHQQDPRAAQIELSEAARPQVPVTEDSVPVVLRFAPFAAGAAAMYQPVKQHTDGKTGARTISTRFITREAAVRTCLEAGGDIELIRPVELREQIVQRAEQQLASHC
ncbi:helix-turn-helix transcriptional regulator [Nesterenkonia alkaliphila]|uniref:WYL domain-containing protein n=1 Tax=Nesterenkonia alkaliphila TaxID=1463631 RepID=A0A7K1UM71_9MICC|nr:WYL domain-containing protein [Nesterenkonia alkaliphila]MVT27578.1 WYL domain-containing protein [Nesterenkonia alkaliphila]GFZ79910.1 hypothetical protein GCM10011359_05390 [Nesterenkonia alkaliphila]